MKLSSAFASSRARDAVATLGAARRRRRDRRAARQARRAAGDAPRADRSLSLRHSAADRAPRSAGSCGISRSIGEYAGMSDHFVSEAVYLQDPDGLGIEVYADRPRSAWRAENNQLAMATIRSTCRVSSPRRATSRGPARRAERRSATCTSTCAISTRRRRSITKGSASTKSCGAIPARCSCRPADITTTSARTRGPRARRSRPTTKRAARVGDRRSGRIERRCGGREPGRARIRGRTKRRRMRSRAIRGARSFASSPRVDRVASLWPVFELALQLGESLYRGRRNMPSSGRSRSMMRKMTSAIDRMSGISAGDRDGSSVPSDSRAFPSSAREWRTDRDTMPMGFDSTTARIDRVRWLFRTSPTSCTNCAAISEFGSARRSRTAIAQSLAVHRFALSRRLLKARDACASRLTRYSREGACARVRDRPGAESRRGETFATCVASSSRALRRESKRVAAQPNVKASIKPSSPTAGVARSAASSSASWLGLKSRAASHAISDLDRQREQHDHDGKDPPDRNDCAAFPA